MAEEEKKEGEAEGEEKKGGKKKLIIIIGAVVILILIGVGAFLALGGKKGEDEESEDEESVEEEEGEEGEHGEALAPAILPLDTFIVNLQVKGSFLKTTIQLEFSEPEVPPTVEKEIPKVRDAIIRLLSSKNAADILSVEGKDKLRQEIVKAVNDALGSEDVTEAYFTEFIIQ